MAESDKQLSEIFSQTVAGFDCTVSITRDLLKAYFSAQPKTVPSETPTAPPASPPPTVPSITVKELIELLSKPLDGDLLERGVLAEIVTELSAGKPIDKRLVARGRQPGPGRDGRIVFLVKPFRDPNSLKPDELKSRSSLHLFDNVKKGQVVARLHQASVGEPGVGVDRSKITGKPGKPLAARFDNTLEDKAKTGHDYSELTATLDGVLIESNNQWTVSEELIINGNLGREHGSIDCIGAVTIKGDVAPGLAVRAHKAIKIGGAIRDSIVESRFDLITIGGHVFGGDGGKIKAQGDVVLRSLERMLVEAGGTITVQKEARLCEMTTGKGLVAPSAQVVGGEATIQGECIIGIVGNDAGVLTALTLTANRDVTSALERLDADITTHTRGKELLELHLGPYGHQPARIQMLRQPFKEKMEQLFGKLTKIKQSLVELEAERKKVESSTQHLESASIVIEKIAHAGLQVTIEDFVWKAHQPIKGPKVLTFNREQKTMIEAQKQKDQTKKGVKK